MAKLISFRILPFHARFNYRNVLVLITILFLTLFLIYTLGPATSHHSKPRRTVTAVDWANTDPKSKRKCFFHNCFELNTCAFGIEDKIGVYTYPMYEFVSNKTRESFSPQVSTQYAELVRAVQSSRYHQNDVTKACVFIPPIDTLNLANLDADVTSALLNSLPTCGHYALEHIILYNT